MSLWVSSSGERREFWEVTGGGGLVLNGESNCWTWHLKVTAELSTCHVSGVVRWKRGKNLDESLQKPSRIRRKRDAEVGTTFRDNMKMRKIRVCLGGE